MQEPRLLSVAEMERTLRTARTIAVLGIKPETRRHLDAHQIPLYLKNVGYQIIPVPVRYPEATDILGAPVFRRLVDVDAPIDVLNVFCKPVDLERHLADIIAVRPGVVWFQSGLMELRTAEALSEAGLVIAEDCIGCRRASMPPSWAPW